MVIWSGAGLLTIVAGIAAIVAGFVMSVVLGLVSGSADFGVAAMFLSIPFIAAALNLAFCKLLERKAQAQALAAQNTYTPGIVNPNAPPADLAPPGVQQPPLPDGSQHTLFFVPMKYWTFLYLLALLPAILITVIGITMQGDDPVAKKAFETASASIDTFETTVAHGNTDAAREAAASFSKLMKSMKDIGFDGGTASNKDFLTYCHETEDSVVFLCTVPEFRKYKGDETKDALAILAWSLARKCVETHFPNHPPETKLAIGLRGFALYGRVWEGTVSEEEPFQKTNDNLDLHKYFAAPAEAPEPTS